MLDAHQARTATAEGHTKTPERARDRSQDAPIAYERDDRTRSDDRRTSDNRPTVDHSDRADRTRRDSSATQAPDKPADPADDEAPATQAAGTQTPADGEKPADPAAPATPDSATTPSVVMLALLTTPVVAAPVEPAAAITSAATTSAATTVAATAASTDQAATPAIATPGGTDASQTQISGTATDKTGAAAPPTAGSAQQGGGQAGADTPSQSNQPKPDAAPVRAAELPRAPAVPASGSGDSRIVQPQQQAAQPQAAVAQVAAAPAPVTAPASGTAPSPPIRTGLPAETLVPLGRTAETVETVLRVAAARGVTHARINLRPAELGAVDVHLRSTPDGLVARVVAHSPEAVQTLQQAAGDLRRSLEEQGLTLLNLDIGQSGERSTGRSGSDAGGLGRGNRQGSDGLPADGADNSTTETTLRLPNGVLVDVLA